MRKNRKTSTEKPRGGIWQYLRPDILDQQLGRHPITIKGFSSDNSLGGACVIVDPRYRDISGGGYRKQENSAQDQLVG